MLLAGHAGSALAGDPAVDDNTILTPDDGTYEVRLTLTGETVCSGVLECNVPEGNYRVVRIDDGSEASSDIVVGDPVDPVIDDATFPYALKVSDRTIEWAVDGWYQVQDARTYAEICNGTDSCTVPNLGRYIVINHSLGLRTELEVGDSVGPVVNGNTISWPDDGWYQVRDSFGGQLVCEGVQACSVPDGTYAVSRLYYGGGTTWTVVLGDVVAPSAGPTVTDDTISWPDDGWYQVEDRLTGAIVCQGGRSCTVPDGIYWVIRFFEGGDSASRIVVGDPTPRTVDQAGFAGTLSVSDRTIGWSVGGWYQVQDAQTFEEICNGTPSCTVPRDGQYIVINHSLGLRTQIGIMGES